MGASASKSDLLYEEVAARVKGLIEAGTLRPGDRIPSVRRLHREWKVSISTVLEAYRRLEDQGYIEARPKSGYYVRLRLLPDEPRLGAPPSRPREVRGSMTYRLMAEVNDPTIIKLGAAVPHPDLLPTKRIGRLIAEELRRHPFECHGYVMSSGAPALRKEIARRLVGAGCSLSPKDLVVTSGAQEGVYLSLRALVGDRPEPTVIVESPAYYGHLETLEVLGIHALPVATHPREGIELDALEEALEEHDVAAMLLVPNFSNPLGALMPQDKRREVLKLASRYGVPIIEDDVFGELAHDHRSLEAIKAHDDEGLVYYCGSFSKTISAGLRVGWVAPGEELDRIAHLKLVTNTAAPGVGQLVLARFLREGGYDRHLRRLRRTYAENLRRMTAAIASHFPAGTRVSRPEGGSLLWVEMPRGVDSLELQERAREHKISIAPGPMFSVGWRYRRYMRLNAGQPWSPQVEAAVRTLGQLAKKL